MVEILDTGTRAGEYRVERLLGRGGMGAVYAAVHPVIGKRAALKVIHTHVVAAAGSADVFVEEARVVNQIGHPNIVDIFGFESLDDGRPVLVMELLEGESLRGMLDRVGRLPATDAVGLLFPILSGLNAAHAGGVVHRDLKPENIFLVRAHDGGIVPKIVDFGMAKLMEAAAEASFTSGSGAPVGTPAYMSPEQCRGESLDARSDVYAIGLILFELLAGRGPFPGGSPAEYLGQQLYAQPARLLDVVQVSAELDALVSRLLSKDRERRPESVAALVDELARIVPTASTSSTGLAQSARLSSASASAAGPSDAAPMPPGAISNPQIGSDPGLGAGMEENRLCTVLFADISGFTALSEKHAPEEVKEIIDRCFGRLSAAVHEHGGRIDKYIGDCLMAVFGVPRSQGDDAERAVRAAMQMQREIDEMARRPDAFGGSPALQLRIGLNTGRVFAGTVGGTERRDFTVMGDAVNVASRLQTAAPKGCVVIGAETSRHLRNRFLLEALPPLKAKGKSEPLAWYRVAGERDGAGSEEPGHALHGGDAPWVGREDVVALLERHLEACRTEGLQRVTLLAPAGMGKSRLAAELAARWSARDDLAVERIDASDRARATPFALVAKVLRRHLALSADAGPEDVEAASGRLLARLGGAGSLDTGVVPSETEAAQRLRDLTDLLGPEGERGTGGGSELRDRVTAATAWFLRHLAARRPLVLLCDGLEEADEASLDVLEQVSIHAPDSPLLVVALCRPDIRDRLPDFGRSGAIAPLPPLSDAEMGELARALLGPVADLSSHTVRTLVARSGGSPLVLREIVRMLFDTGIIRREGDNLRIDASRVQEMDLPSTVYGIVQAHLDRLPPDERMLLMRAAVVGRTFWEGALTDTLGSGEEAKARSRLLLGRIVARALVRPVEMDVLPGQAAWSFNDGVVQEVAYEAMPLRLRQRQHQAIADWIEAHGEALARAHPAVLARHYDGGGVPRSAFPYHVKAGHQATRLGRNEEALTHLARARQIADEARNLEPAPAGPDGVSDPKDLRVADWTERAQLHIDLGDVLMRLGRLDEAEAVFQAAMRNILREERRAGERLDSSRVAFYDGLVELRFGLVQKTRGNHEDALACFEAALDRIGGDGDPLLQMQIGAEIGWVRQRLGDASGCIEASLAALRLGRRLDPADPEGKESVARLLLGIGSALYQRQQLVRAERLFRLALRTAQAAGRLHQASIALNNLAAIHFAAGDVHRAADLFQQSLSLKERQGGLYDIAVANNNLAEVSLALGHTDEALDHARRAVRVFESLEATDVLPDAVRNLADALLASDRPLEALRAAERAFDLAQRPGARTFMGAVGVTYARACAAAAKRDPAAAAVAQACARARHHVVPSLEEAALDGEAAACLEVLSEIPDP